MSDLTKEELQSLLKIQQKSMSWFGTFDLFVESFGRTIEVSVALSTSPSTLTDRTVQTVNEVAHLNRAHYEYILRLLFDDAMNWKAEAFSTDPPPPPHRGPMNWLRRILQGPGVVELSIEEHPLFGIDTPAGLEAIIKWETIYIDDCQETSKRVAFLTCHPPWEIEHGREIAICNGVPTGIGPIELDEYGYVDA